MDVRSSTRGDDASALDLFNLIIISDIEDSQPILRITGLRSAL